MGLSRSSSGLLVRDDFASDTTGSYTKAPASGSAWAVGSGLLTATYTSGNFSSFRRNSLTTCACATCLVKPANATAGAGLLVCTGTPADGGGEFASYRVQLYGGKVYLQNYVSGSQNNLANTNFSFNTSTYYLLRGYTSGGRLYGKWGTTSLANANDVADTNFSGGSGGMRIGNANASYDWLDLRTSHLITCTGVPTGSYLRVTDGTTAAEAAESSGTATVNAGAVLFPLASVAIYTASGGGGTKTAEITSGTLADMGGGDVFAYAADAAAATGTCAISSTASGAAVVAKLATGTCASASTVTGVANKRSPATGTSASVSTAAGAAIGAKVATGTAAIISQVTSSVVAVRGPCSGTASATSGASGSAGKQAPATGAATSTSTASGDAVLTWSVTGACAIVSTAAGDATVAEATHYAATGTATITSAATGNPLVLIAAEETLEAKTSIKRLESKPTVRNLEACALVRWLYDS